MTDISRVKQIHNTRSTRRFSLIFFAEWAYFLGICFAVIPFGAVYPILNAIVCLVFAGLTLLTLFRQSRSRPLQRFSFQITVCILVLLIWCFVQAIPFAQNTFAHPIWRDVSKLLGDIDAAISINPGATLESTLTLSGPFLAALAGLQIFNSDAAALRLWRFLARFGAAVVLITFVQHLLFPGTILFYDKWAYEQDFTATFVNRNTAGTFVGTVLCLNLSLVFLALQDLEPAQLGRKLRKMNLSFDGPERRVLLQMLMTFIIFIALTLTRSRGAVACSLMAVIVLFFIFYKKSLLRFFQQTERSGRLLGALAGLVIVVSVVAAFWLFGGATLSRVANDGVEDISRLCTYVSILSAIQDHWLVGTGFGTFIDAFPGYRNPACSGIEGVWDRGHNSYLEFILGVGILGLFAIGFVITSLVWAFAHGLKTRRSLRAIPAASFGILVLVATHALFDFSLQIPGFAVFAAVTLMAGTMVSYGRD